MTDNEIWMFWCNRPAVEEGEDDSMEAELVSTVRRILAASQQPARKVLTKTVIGNYLRRALHGDSEMYRNGFKDGARFAEQAHGITGGEG